MNPLLLKTSKIIHQCLNTSNSDGLYFPLVCVFSIKGVEGLNKEGEIAEIHAHSSCWVSVRFLVWLCFNMWNNPKGLT